MTFHRARQIGSACTVVAAAMLGSCGGVGSRSTSDATALGRAFAGADSLRDNGDFAKAIARYRELRDSLAPRGDSAARWQAQNGLADAFLRASRLDSAAVAFTGALALAGSDAHRRGQTVARIALLDSRRGRLDSALAEANLARRDAASVHDTLVDAGALHVIGEVESVSGHYRAAIAANEQQLALRRAQHARPRDIANVLSQLGIDLRHIGRQSDAVNDYQQALAIYRRERNAEGIARVSYNLAITRESMGDFDTALQLMTAALHGVDSTGNVRGQATVLDGIADVYLQTGNAAAARPYVERALAATSAARLWYPNSSELLNLGHASLAEGRADSATRVYQRALRLADSLGFGRQRASARVGLARAALAKGDAPTALRWAERAVAVADSLGDPEAQYDALTARAAALERARSSGAADAYLEVIKLLESWRGRLALGDLRMGVTSPRLEPYEGAIRVLLARGRAGDAFGVAERARARLLLELMANRGARAASPSARDSLRDALRERYEARSDAGTPKAEHELDAAIALLADSLARIDSTIARVNPAAALRYPVAASVAALRPAIVRGGRSLVAFFWGDSAVYGWWISRNSIHAARLGSADSLGVLVDFLYGSIERPETGDAWQSAARRAYARLVEPLAPDSAGELFAITDGPLSRIPLEVLLPADNAPPLGATRRITYGPSASVLVELAHQPSAASWRRGVLAIGDPTVTEHADDGVEQAGANRAAPLAPLPFAAQEARAVGEIFRDAGTDVLVGPDATRQRWLALQPARYRVLHFAAHARVDDRHPERTALLLSDGELDLAAIRATEIDAQVVTLSACETALGERVRGEGIIGLPHAFLAAGARSTVVSLWRVSDQGTERFMEDFYRELRAGRSPAAALSDARRKRIGASGAGAHPSTWAAFVLVGASE
ncbi:MAG TPA: CHAT domain-containing protein [Gemmatimonadaceae bacterium]|nr:CHAT domain-containing protein [Gemmatimonadaceae bacterium]